MVSAWDLHTKNNDARQLKQCFVNHLGILNISPAGRLD